MLYQAVVLMVKELQVPTE